MAIEYNGSKVKRIIYNRNVVNSLKNSDGTYMWAAEGPLVEVDYSGCDVAASSIYNSRISSLEPTASLWEKSYTMLRKRTFYVGDKISFGAETEPPAGYRWNEGPNQTEFTVEPVEGGGILYVAPKIYATPYPDNLEEYLILDSYETEPNGADFSKAKYYTFWNIYNPNDYTVSCSYQDYYVDKDGHEIWNPRRETLSISPKKTMTKYVITCSQSSSGSVLGLKVVLSNIQEETYGRGYVVPELVFKTKDYDSYLAESTTTTTS